MKKDCMIAMALTAALLLASCRPSAPAASTDAPATESPQKPDHYAMPDIPTTATTPVERANFVAEHYWDRFPFDQQPDTAFTEQAFVDYIAVLPIADAAPRREGIAQLLARLKAPQLQQLMDLAAHYLGNPQSPMRSDELYTDFLRAFVALPSVADEEKTRPRFLLTNLSKNMPGTTATDFAYITSGGQRSSLHQLQASFIVLYFNDPDCESCREELPHAFAAPELRDPRVRVLLINVLREQTIGSVDGQPLPTNWIDAYSPGGYVDAHQLYYLPATPSFYLLDGQHRIILKDAPLADITRYIATNQ